MHNAVIVPCEDLEDPDDLICIGLAAMAYRPVQHLPAPSIKTTWGRPSDVLDILRAAHTPLSAVTLAQRLNTTPKYAYQSAQVLCQRGLAIHIGVPHGYLYAPKDC